MMSFVVFPMRAKELLCFCICATAVAVEMHGRGTASRKDETLSQVANILSQDVSELDRLLTHAQTEDIDKLLTRHGTTFGGSPDLSSLEARGMEADGFDLQPSERRWPGKVPDAFTPFALADRGLERADPLEGAPQPKPGDKSEDTTKPGDKSEDTSQLADDDTKEDAAEGASAAKSADKSADSKDTSKATKEDWCGGDGQPSCGTFAEIVTLKGKLPFIPGIILTVIVLLLVLSLFYFLISWCCRTAASVQKDDAEDELHEVWVLEKGKK